VCRRSGFDPGAYKLHSGFHPSGVGKMSSNWYVVVVTTTEYGGVKVCGLEMAYAASGTHYLA